ncbi:MAG: type II secretion system F family protein [Candidatus Rokubacteria bacterium]|nr:type II secretion system F family protein [Candidatus Rokubacteria bacterium]MBI3825563.1 type II secretion system F family protein [Candidatus Rokubacteria bacterium]
MSVFAYKGRAVSGAVAGQIEAADRTAAVQQLRARGVVATSISQRRERGAGFSVALWGSKVKDKDLAIYTRQFATMVNAGLPVAQCLAILAEQGDSPKLREVTGKVAQDVEGGRTLAESFRKHPKVFNELFVNMLQVGETGGALDVVLQRLSTYIEKAASLRRKVKGAMVYPITIFSVAGIVVIFMMTFIIPTFANMFKNLNTDLPLPTQIVVWLSDFTRTYILLIVAAAGGGAFGLRRYYATDKGSLAIDTILLRLPILAPLLKKVSIARFTRTLGTLIACGVPILEGLRITAKTSGNRVVEGAVMQARAAVTAGRTVADPLRASSVFPPMVTQMINVGEQTGALDQMLTKIADFYEEEVDDAVTVMTSLIEPLMIVILGVVVGGLVVALYLPIFRLVTLFK